MSSTFKRRLAIVVPGAWIGSVLVGLTAAVSLLVLEVIDDPMGGAWGISVEPFRRISFGRASDG